MSAYEALAASYDRLTDDVAYRATADYLERLLAAWRPSARCSAKFWRKWNESGSCKQKST